MEPDERQPSRSELLELTRCTRCHVPYFQHPSSSDHRFGWPR